MRHRLLAAILILCLATLWGAWFAQDASRAQQNRFTLNGSAVITAGNTFQTVLAAAPRWSLTIQNNNASDSCWVYIGSGSATKGTSIQLDTTHGTAYTRYFPYVPSDAIQATCATTSDTLYVDTQ